MYTLHHDFQSNGPWDAKHNPGNPVLFTTFRNFMACARGFRQAKLDRSVRLKTDVRHVMQRSAIFITGGNNYPVDDGFASWGPMLVKAGINTNRPNRGNCRCCFLRPGYSFSVLRSAVRKLPLRLRNGFPPETKPCFFIPMFRSVMQRDVLT